MVGQIRANRPEMPEFFGFECDALNAMPWKRFLWNSRSGAPAATRGPQRNINTSFEIRPCGENGFLVCLFYTRPVRVPVVNLACA